MKLSCLPVSLFGDICSGKMTLSEWACTAKKIGYDGIDISIMFLKNRTPTYLKSLKEELGEIGIPIVMMTTYPDFTHPCPLQRERELLYLKGDVALCSELGIQYLRILAGQAHPESSVEDCIDWVDGYFHQIDLCAKEFGVNLVFERSQYEKSNFERIRCRRHDWRPFLFWLVSQPPRRQLSKSTCLEGGEAICR